MILDNELLFADGTWAPTATGDNIAPTIWDSGPLGGNPTANAGRDFGQGHGVWMVITVLQTVTSGGAATVDFRIRTDSGSNLTTSPVDLIATGAIAKATLVAGYQTRLKFPSIQAQNYKRYLGANANIGTAALTAGKFHIAVVLDIQGNTKYAGAYTVDV